MALSAIAQSLVDYLRQKRARSLSTNYDGTVSSYDGNDIGTSLTTRAQADAMQNPKPFMSGADNPQNASLPRSNFDLATPTNNGGNTSADNSGNNPDIDSLLNQKLNEYSQLSMSPAKKQNPWSQAAFLGLQALQHGLNPRDDTPVQLLGNAKKQRALNDIKSQIAPLLQQRQIQQQQQQFNSNEAYKNAQTNALTEKPAIDREKIAAQRDKDNAMAEYRTNLLSLGKEKADNIKAYRDAIIDLKQQGVDQNDTRIQQAQDRIDEISRHNKSTEKQNAVNEEGRNTRAANTETGRMTRSNDRINAANDRANQELDFKKQVREQIKQVGAAEARRKMVNSIRAQHPDATDEEINSYIKPYFLP